MAQPATKTRRRMSPEAQLALARFMVAARNDWRRSRTRLLRSMWGLVRKLVAEASPSAERDDLKQVAALAMMNALDKWEDRSDGGLVEYLAAAIRGALQHAVRSQGRTVRVSDKVLPNIAHLDRAIDDLRQDLGHEPTAHEIAVAVGGSEAEVEELLSAGKQPGSLDTTVLDEDGEEVPFGHLVPEGATAWNSRAELREELDLALSVLSDRERQVITARYGWQDGVQRSQGEVAGLLGIGQQWVAKIEARALEKMGAALARRDIESSRG